MTHAAQQHSSTGVRGAAHVGLCLICCAASQLPRASNLLLKRELLSAAVPSSCVLHATAACSRTQSTGSTDSSVAAVLSSQTAHCCAASLPVAACSCRDEQKYRCSVHMSRLLAAGYRLAGQITVVQQYEGGGFGLPGPRQHAPAALNSPGIRAATSELCGPPRAARNARW